VWLYKGRSELRPTRSVHPVFLQWFGGCTQLQSSKGGEYSICRHPFALR